MRLLIVTDSYPPEVRSAGQLMSELAEGLAARGEEVTVATTEPRYNLAAPAPDLPPDRVENGVRVLRVRVLPHHKVAYLLRGVNQLLLPGMFARAVRRLTQGPFDRVIVHSPPLPLALAAGRLARGYGASFVANVHDIFPQNGIDLVVWWQKPLIQLFFGPMERRVYRDADIIIVPSGNHARFLEERRSVPAEKLEVIPHWIDTRPYDSAGAGGSVGEAIASPRQSRDTWRKAWGLEGKFVFFFGGVIGPSQELDMALDAAEAFRSTPDVLFLFVGDGGDRARLERLASEKRLMNVLFMPFVSSFDYPALVREMDVGMITLTSKNTTPAVPGKLMGCMAAGIPVVVAVHRESDALRIVTEAKCGFTALSSDRATVVQAFRDAYAARGTLAKLGANGRRYVDEHFAREKLVTEWERVLRAR